MLHGKKEHKTTNFFLSPFTSQEKKDAERFSDERLCLLLLLLRVVSHEFVERRKREKPLRCENIFQYFHYFEFQPSFLI